MLHLSQPESIPHIMQRTVVINIVALSEHLITPHHTPFLHQYLSETKYLPITPVLPSVTTTQQSTYLTGELPSVHGIVGNGWYSREDAEVKFWKQSNHLVQAPKLWDTARHLSASKPNQNFTVANSFWWYNMYSSVDYSVTPRPMYPADGRKIPDIYTHPPQLRSTLQEKFGPFPLFNFWGPRADITSSIWIVQSAKYIEETYSPTLHLVYIPHLDYCLQKIGCEPHDIPDQLKELDDLLADFVPWLEARNIEIILLSEYGINAVDNPVNINRSLREIGMIAVRDELGREILDPGASRAFAVADHQIAHIYVNDESAYAPVLKMVKSLSGVGRVLDDQGKREVGLDHCRAGDIVLIAEPNAWFTYYYWNDDSLAPDFARCVDIHRKPGYDPVDLFVDPQIMFPLLTIGGKLVRKELGFRYLMDIIPLDASLVKGSHGAGARSGMFITKRKDLLQGTDKVEAVHVRDLILRHLKLLQ